MSWSPPTEEEKKKINVSRLNKHCYGLGCATPLSKSNSHILVLRGEVEILNELAQSFFEELRAWRNNLGAERGLTPLESGGRIVSNAVLEEIAKQLPLTEEALSAIQGIGEQTMVKFALQILMMTEQHAAKIPRRQRKKEQRVVRKLGVLAAQRTCVSCHPESRTQTAKLSSANFVILDKDTGDHVSSNLTIFNESSRGNFTILDTGTGDHVSSDFTLF